MDHLLRLLPLLACLTGQASAADPPDRPRLVVLTDIGSLTAGVAEPDDGQSVIRLMFYTNDFDIEGLIASSNLGHGQRVRPDLIRRVVDAYGEALPNLLLHDDRYPPASDLAGIIKAGRPIAGPNVPVEQSVGEGKDTEGSDWIIEVVDRDDPRPLWVLIWGGSADLAQALWRVRADRSPEDLDRFLARLRVHSIGDQDATGPWIRDEFPGLYTIIQRRAYRGMYRGGDPELVSSDWVREHIHGHGPLGDLYPDYDGGDIWSRTLGRVRGIKEGDTPSFLSLIPNGLGDTEDPWLGSWGGRFEGEGHRLADVADADLDTSGDPDPRMSSVYRWRPAFQADFRARLDWCAEPYEQANHPPVVRIAGERDRSVSPGGVITLDAGASSDPDGDELSFAWSVYPQPADAEAIPIEDLGSGLARLTINPDASARTIPVLLTVTDDGDPPLTRYGRVLVRVDEGGDSRPR
ncbi:nucleoside hydrolase-like domain-containing protein [Tautonia plasticadhaerens]|uniref:DUF1593 domain-containing protein n=1 Tax=Tautonia plasticadhaerens TaxID=2527974 RepID=A0A518H3T3_9BACT|nr:nucleoside hydrolase-like domain-containing protein [Tautonia plasticadhaerens]QDV35516.1 hypothetical protein ElP_34190 [Tautonia plasticadhaerens]